jgi:DMSO/TMAO reductase YedYZ molybdopterin-dependent catalytic subunit
MSRTLLTRRKLIGLGAAGATSLALNGCDQFDFLGADNSAVRAVLEKANNLTYRAQRLLIRDGALATEYSETEIRQGQRPNGSRDPQTETYLALRNNDFADYRLSVTGLVEWPKSYSLTELNNMPSRTQITRHDCVEGWSCVAKWTGTPLSVVLDDVRVQPAARFVVFHCFDRYGGGTKDDFYYESCDLIDARHPQTILAYRLNGSTLPVANGAPIRVRIERALGYKQPKYVHTIELVDSFSRIGGGKGGYWEDRGYDWFAGI